MLLAKIGANATVVSAGLLHDTIDDSFIDYDHIFHMFGAGVADLVEGVCVPFPLDLDNLLQLENIVISSVSHQVVGLINCNYDDVLPVTLSQ